MKSNKISSLSRIFCFAGCMALAGSLFVPLWRIELDAPQYPEGLALLIYPNKIAGDVDIINGLNHYIGMKTLHTEDFLEFTLLPYIITFFAMLVLLTGIIGKRKLLFFTLTLFIIFGVVSMVDFYRWNYNYGHDLDPTAAIIVPGMAYQPPLIGYKVLLNFGAYSIPDKGGWLFIVCGLLLLAAVAKETRLFGMIKSKTTVLPLLLIIMFSISACDTGKPEPIKLHSDSCNFCKMTIADGKFAAEMITEKGRVYKFDDIICMLEYIKENTSTPHATLWVNHYTRSNELIDAESAWYVNSEELRSPMAGNIAAFADKDSAMHFASKAGTTLMSWDDIYNK
jgi:copper chaperone NosL